MPFFVSFFEDLGYTDVAEIDFIRDRFYPKLILSEIDFTA